MLELLVRANGILILMEHGEQPYDDRERQEPQTKLDKLIQASGFVETEFMAQLRGGMVEVYDPDNLEGFLQLGWYYHALAEEAIDRTGEDRVEEKSDVEADRLAQLGLMLREAGIWEECGNLWEYYEALKEALWQADNFKYKASATGIRSILDDLDELA